MTIEQLNYLLRNELYAIKNHKDNIDRIKKEYFDSNYGLKEGDKIRILHETGDEMIGFLKKVEVCEDGDLYLTIQKQPDWYKWECSETQQYKMLGNGWTIKVIEHILKRIKE